MYFVLSGLFLLMGIVGLAFIWDSLEKKWGMYMKGEFLEGGDERLKIFASVLFQLEHEFTIMFVIVTILSLLLIISSPILLIIGLLS